MKKQKPLQLSPRSELETTKRRVHSIDGVIKGATKVESAKGQKGYKRGKFKDPKNW